MISKPYPRIFIPMLNQKTMIELCPYIKDERYVTTGECLSLINAVRNIICDFVKLTEYIEPIDINKFTFSHRLYELLLRIATEFESNCKGILQANGYSVDRNLNVTDYHKINSIMKLDKYILETDLWYPAKRFSPLSEWANSHTLKWYQAYNKSKHNRFSCFSEANLDNVFHGMCSLVVLLAAQFPSSIGLLDGSDIIMSTDEDDNSIIIKNFVVTYPNWDIDERCKFDWNALKNEDKSFQYYAF